MLAQQVFLCLPSLNCILNQKLRVKLLFSEIWIQTYREIIIDLEIFMIYSLLLRLNK